MLPSQCQISYLPDIIRFTQRLFPFELVVEFYTTGSELRFKAYSTRSGVEYPLTLWHREVLAFFEAARTVLNFNGQVQSIKERESPVVTGGIEGSRLDPSPSVEQGIQPPLSSK